MENNQGWDIESLSRKLHDIYQIEAKRQGDVRHFDSYDDLSENIKEFDRVLARFILTELAKKDQEIKQAREEGYAAGREEAIREAVDAINKQIHLVHNLLTGDEVKNSLIRMAENMGNVILEDLLSLQKADQKENKTI